MAIGVVRSRNAADEFARLHGLFVQHLGFATAFAWAAAAGAAVYAPWTRNLRGLIDPTGRAESTFSYLFLLPLLMAAAWVCVALGAETIRRGSLLKNQSVEFALAGIVAFAVFCVAIHRAVTAVALGF